MSLINQKLGVIPLFSLSCPAYVRSDQSTYPLKSWCCISSSIPSVCWNLS